MVLLGGATKDEKAVMETYTTGSKKRKINSTEVNSSASSKKPRIAEISSEMEKKEFSYKALRPTFTHRALAKLNNVNKMDYCITQNCDDLHASGGFPRNCLSELHGNVFCEYCEDCSTEYVRDFEVDAWSTDW